MRGEGKRIGCNDSQGTPLWPNAIFGGCVRQDFPPAPPPILRNQTIGGDPVNSSPAWGLLLSEFYRTRNPKHDSPVEGLLERGINISRNARSRASDNQSDLRKVLLRLPTSTSLSRTASFILYEPGTGDFAPVGVPGDSESRNLINEIPTSIYRWFPTYVASCLEALILPN